MKQFQILKRYRKLPLPPSKILQLVIISNFKTPQELAGLEALHFKIKILPLLKGQVELKELVLYSPVINLAKNKEGVMNIDDLIQTSKEPWEKKKELEAKGKADPIPITADAILVAIAVGEIGMKNGTINYRVRFMHLPP